jgi:hypothetical protein
MSACFVVYGINDWGPIVFGVTSTLKQAQKIVEENTRQDDPGFRRPEIAFENIVTFPVEET